MGWVAFLTLVNTVLIALVLVAGGWVTVRDYFIKKNAAKLEAAEASAKAEAERIEALVQARLKEVTTKTTSDSTTV